MPEENKGTRLRSLAWCIALEHRIALEHGQSLQKRTSTIWWPMDPNARQRHAPVELPEYRDPTRAPCLQRAHEHGQSLQKQTSKIWRTMDPNARQRHAPVEESTSTTRRVDMTSTSRRKPLGGGVEIRRRKSYTTGEKKKRNVKNRSTAKLSAATANDPMRSETALDGESNEAHDRAEAKRTLTEMRRPVSTNRRS